jgi:ABC-2 family transporter protein
MTAVARMAMLNLRTVVPYRYQSLLVFALGVLLFADKPAVLVPALVFFFTSQFASYPFNVADKAGLDTLYAVLPLPRRSVLYGHYTWAVALFVATASVSTVLAVLFAHAEAVPLGGRTIVTVLTLSWALFAVNVAIQFPLLIRFGYTRVSVLGTALPLAVVIGTVYKLHLTMPAIQVWLPILWIAGLIALMASAAVATTADGRRLRFRPAKTAGPGGQGCRH